MTEAEPLGNKAAALTVYFDGACPLCRREINMYRQVSGSDKIAWVDVSATPGSKIEDDLSKIDALRRFHVRREDGELTSGAEAFADLWMALPGLSCAGKLLALPGIRHVAELFYRVFLYVRPLVQRLMSR